MRTWRRAVREEQRDQRRDTILAAAEALFLRKELADISMAEVGQRAGLAKGTLYLYFPTRETRVLWVRPRLLSGSLASGGVTAAPA